MEQNVLSESLVEAARRVRDREITARELVQASLDHIDASDATVGAFASVQADAAVAAANACDERQAAGESLGALHGVPIAVKDLLHTAGVVTAANCDAYGDFVPAADATVVARLRAAGAIIVGKLNTHELAFGVSCPASRNPWDTDRMTGGSSGGSGAALAARQVFGALGTDTGGSVRIPSNYCGTTGLKTTRGLVPRDGMHMLSWTYDTVGPMARSAEDCGVLLDAIAGSGDADPYSVATELMAAKPVADLVVGVPSDSFFDGIAVDPQVMAISAAAAIEIAGLVAGVRPIDLPATAEHGEQGSAIAFAEAAALNRHAFESRPERFGEEVRALLAIGMEAPAVDLARAQQIRVQFERDFTNAFAQAGVDAVLMPVTPNQVLPHGIDNLGGVPLIPATTQFTFPINGVGMPSIALPGGFADDGLPIGFQIVGPAFTERTLLALGQAYQQLTDHHTKAPPV